MHDKRAVAPEINSVPLGNDEEVFDIALACIERGVPLNNIIYEASGITVSLLGASFEAMLIDAEMLSPTYRILRGSEVTEETLGFDAIKESVYGAGHLLSAQHTIDTLQRDYFRPSTLTGRQAPAVWEEDGAKDMCQHQGERNSLRA
jgi:trimethylamine--corrinoid protein Co-methyltransferase